MGWFSNHGTGVMIHGIERGPDGRRVEFTSWVCLFFVPVVPLRSWSGVYLGEGHGDGVNDETHRFADLRRIPHDWGRIILTFGRGLFAVACAVAPACYMVSRTTGRAATRAEMVFVLASAVGPVVIIFWAAHVRRRRLRGG